MNDTRADKKVDEISRLLERIDRVGPAAKRNIPPRNLPSEQISQPRDATPRRDPVPSQRDLQFAMEYRAFLAGKQSAGPGPWVYLLITTLNTIVITLVAALVLGNMRHDLFPLRFGRAPADAPPSASGKAMRSITLQPVGTPEHPLRLEAGKRTRLPLQISPANAVTDSYFLILSGVPSLTSVTGATRIGTDIWLVPPNAIGQIDVAVADGPGIPSRFGIQLRYSNGVEAARAEGWLIVEASAAEAATARPDASATAGMITQAEHLLVRGDIVAARTLYERAAEAGNAEAALTLGATYDPSRLWFLGTLGVAGNKQRAREWYVRADKLGHPDAKARLGALGN
jgi:hypothetical protein